MIGKMPIFRSKFTPDVEASAIPLEKGQKVWYGGKVEVVIDSEPMQHDNCPNLGYECIFQDNGERGFADSEGLTWTQAAGIEKSRQKHRTTTV